MIALDVPGGDFAPHATLSGALGAARRGVSVLLCGPSELMRHRLHELDSAWHNLPITLAEAPDIIEMGEHPALAVRNKPHSSLGVAVQAVAAGQARGVVSAGNSGALMVAALRMLGLQDGIERPAIAGWLPARTGRVLCLDLGANTDCKPRYLVQFAHLGAELLREEHGITSPRIGLLSNGSEPQKGSQLVQEAHELLRTLPINFIGNVEPAAVLAGEADVVVSDGFAGNILLKTLEAAVALCGAVSSSPFDWREEGGARLVGVRGVVFVAHGCSDQRAIEQALIRAWESSFGRNHGASRHSGIVSSNR